jgi:hypothetical protein
MTGRLEPLVEKRRLMNRFDVELPERLDDVAARDGIIEKAPGGIGERAWWLRQVVASVPLSWWEDRLGLDAISLAAKAPIADVRLGWIEAARRQSDSRWAAALFDAEPAVDLLPLMSETDRAARLVAACHGDRPFRKRPPYTELAQMLGHAATPWSPELSVAVADLFFGTAEDLKGASGLAGMLNQAHPAVVDRLAGSIHRLPDYWQRFMRDAISQITFRRSVEEEFS